MGKEVAAACLRRYVRPCLLGWMNGWMDGMTDTWIDPSPYFHDTHPSRSAPAPCAHNSGLALCPVGLTGPQIEDEQVEVDDGEVRIYHIPFMQSPLTYHHSVCVCVCVPWSCVGCSHAATTTHAHRAGRRRRCGWSRAPSPATATRSATRGCRVRKGVRPPSARCYIETHTRTHTCMRACPGLPPPPPHTHTHTHPSIYP